MAARSTGVLPQNGRLNRWQRSHYTYGSKCYGVCQGVWETRWPQARIGNQLKAEKETRTPFTTGLSVKNGEDTRGAQRLYITNIIRNALQIKQNTGGAEKYSLDPVKPIQPKNGVEKKATALLQGAKVLMPKMPATHSGGFIHSLTGKDSSVKAENENITESRRRMISPTKKQTLNRQRQRRTLKARQ